MTTFQIIGLIVVALLGLYVFYCIYDLEKFNKKKDRRKKNKVLSLALLFFAIVADKSVSAQNSWTVSASNSGTKTTFAIRRSGDLSIQETVYYRTVNLSAVDGKNYTSATGSKTFGPGDYEKTVEITETPSNNVEEAYHFQTTTDRTYRFEVLDEGGFELAHADRTISYDGDYRHTATYVNKSITDLAYFDNDGNLCSGINSSKYMEVCHSGSQNNWIQVTDAGYSQGVYSMSTNNLFHSSSALRTYLSNRSNKMYATVIFSQKEEQDGYQYIQILANNASTYDGNDPNGAVNDPSTSLYKACFILSYANSGSVITTAHQQFFPHRYAYVDKATERQAGLTHYEFDSGDSHLYQQKYRLPAFNADNTGSLNLPMTAQTINVRFDAAGSGGDNWDFINLRIRLALLDATAPTLLNNYQVSGGRHSKGNPIYISIAFNEIVTYTGGNNRKINTTWGDFAYCAGEGTNVLTFKGNISATATSALSVTGYQGTIKDLAGNQFNGTISKYFGTALQDNYNYSISYDLAGGTLATPNPTSYNYETATFMLNNPTKSHYTFTGWTGNNITVPSSSVTVYNHSHGNRHYHAFYSPTEYNIAYDLGGGEIPGGQSNPATYTIETPSFTLVNPTRAGYTFDGWTGTGISEPTQTATIAQGSVNDRSYTAHWMLDTWTGTGTPDDPFIIVNAGQLEMLATRVNSGSGDDYASLGYSGKYFKLGNDIDMSGIANFTPIGTSGRHFKGNFDGNGKTIGNLTIDRLGVEYVGLFGYLDQCTIQNLILDNANVTGGMCTGCVVGEYYHSSIINCLVKNSAVTANSSNSGVIAGYVSFTDPMGSTSNYYHNCSRTHNDATTNVNIGVNNSDQYWARSVHGLTLPTNVTANGESVVIGESNYFASNTTVTLSYNNLPAGYVVNYSYNDGTSHSLDGNAFTMPAADASVSVNVVEAIYSITYNLDGGTVSNINPYTYTVNTPTFSLNNPIKPGYVFDGWIGTDHTEATMTLSIVQGSTGDREYTATWSVYVEPCSVVTFPWSEDFSTYEIGEFHDDCWLNEHISGEGAFLFDVYNDQDGMQLRLQNIPTASQTMLRLPKMVFANDNYELLIDVYRDLVEGNDGFRIYASIDGAIEGATELAFIPRYRLASNDIIPTEAINKYYTYELPIGVVGTCYIIICGESGSNYNMYLDNLCVQQIPACHAPINLQVGAVSAHGFHASFTPRDNNQAEWIYAYSTDDAMPTAAMGTTNQPEGFDVYDPNILSSTEYHLWIGYDCEIDDTLYWSRSATFTTFCEDITTLPYTYGFETEAPFNCWIVSDGTGTYEDSNYSNNGSHFLSFSGTTNNIAAIPPIAYATNTLRLEFWTRPEEINALCGSFDVGYLTDITDTTTFVAIETYRYDDWINTDYVKKKVDFNNAPADSYIAMRQHYNSSAWYWFVDDVTVKPIPPCNDVIGLAVVENSVSGHGATITWDAEPSSTFQWKIDEEWHDIQGNTIELTDLTPETYYTFTIRSKCGDTDFGEAEEVSFTTLVSCPAPTGFTVEPGNYSAEVNWIGYSDSYTVSYRIPSHIEIPVNTETFSSEPLDWEMKKGLLSDIMDGGDFQSGSGWSFVTSNDVFDTHARLNIYGNNPCNSWLITPEIELLENYGLSFDLALTQYNGSVSEPQTSGTDDRFVVLITTNNEATWTILREWNNTGSTYIYNDITCSATGEKVTIDLTSYANETVRIAFYGESTVINADNNLHIDNVTFGLLHQSEDWHTVYTDNTTATAVDLTPETTYELKVQGDCGEYGHSRESYIILFTTLEACPNPRALNVSDITTQSATVSWRGYNDNYNVNYREAAYVQSILSEGFEGEASFAGWIAISMNDENEDKFGRTTEIKRTGDYGFKFSSFATAFNSDYRQYLISPQLSEIGNLEFYYSAYASGTEYFSVGYSSTSNRIDDFTWGEEISDATFEWSHFQEDMPEGTKYFAIRYSSNYQYYLYIDDITIDAHEIPAGGWQTGSPVGTSAYLTDLTPGLPYEVKVQGICDDDETEWSEILAFNTLPQATTETFIKDIGGYGSDDSGTGWYLIASPLADATDPSDVTNLTINTYDLYRFNQNSNNEWENYKAHTDGFVLEPGRGYLYANSENVTLTFYGTPYDGNGEIALSRTDDTEFEGWNLVGNPFNVAATVDKDFYCMNEEGSEIIAAADHSITTVNPMEGIFVHADSDDDIVTFTPNSRNNKAVNSNNASLVINLSKSSNSKGWANTIIDRAIVRIGNNSTLPKLQLFHDNAKLYIPQCGKDYAIAFSDGQGDMPVNFKARQNGTYTIAVIPENMDLNYLYLVDNLTGANINLLVEPSYTFTARNDDYASRFKLVFNANENENQNENEDFAFISNGEIIITGEGIVQLIDVLGHQLVSRQVTSDFRLPTSDFSAGVYVLRLINGQNVKTQKIVIR